MPILYQNAETSVHQFVEVLRGHVRRGFSSPYGDTGTDSGALAGMPGCGEAALNVFGRFADGRRGRCVSAHLIVFTTIDSEALFLPWPSTGWILGLFAGKVLRPFKGGMVLILQAPVVFLPADGCELRKRRPLELPGIVIPPVACRYRCLTSTPNPILEHVPYNANNTGK